MENLTAHIDQICAVIDEHRDPDMRFMVAIAGPPASGKSTLSAAIVKHLGGGAVLVPMDGFHLDNRVLEARGHLSRKGAPHTFDADGFLALLKRIKADDGDVSFPIFDRDLDCAIAGAGMVEPHHKIVVIEGNYLLLDQAPWRDIHHLYDATAFLNVSIDILEQRSVERWQHYGWPDDKARKHIAHNDLPNMKLVLENSLNSDITIKSPKK